MKSAVLALIDLYMPVLFGASLE